MTTNLTNLTSATGLYDIALFVNQETGYIFFTLAIILFFGIMVLALKKEGTIEGIWASSGITFVLCLILAQMQLIFPSMIYVFLGIFVLAGMYIWATR